MSDAERSRGDMIEGTSSHGDACLKYLSHSITIVSMLSVVASHGDRIRDTEARRFWRRSCAPAGVCRILPKLHIPGDRPCIATWRWDTLSWMLQHLQFGVSSPKGAPGLPLQVVISCHVVHGVQGGLRSKSASPANLCSWEYRNSMQLARMKVVG